MICIKVKDCIDCPFHQYEYDDWSTGYDTFHRCMLAVTLDMDVGFISMHDSKDADDNSELITPNWCPLTELKIVKV